MVSDTAGEGPPGSRGHTSPRVALRGESQQLEMGRLFGGGTGSGVGSGEQDRGTQCDYPALGHGLTFCGDTNPVEVASQLLGDVGLTPGREAHHHDHRRGVGQLRPTGWEEQPRKVPSVKQRAAGGQSRVPQNKVAPSPDMPISAPAAAGRGPPCVQGPVRHTLQLRLAELPAPQGGPKATRNPVTNPNPRVEGPPGE